jgi:uncharacterized glyoxalase superfamily protein PhnB
MTTRLWPNLGYSDAPAAIRFLVTAFGFEEVAVYPAGSADTIGYAMLRWPGGGFVTLHSSGPGSVAELTAKADASGGYPAFSVHIDTDDPDAVYARAVAAGAMIVRELADSPLGTRGFVARDPEGLYWSIGTPLPGLTRDGEGRWRPAPAKPSPKAGKPRGSD